MAKAAVIGGSGYTGAELLRLLAGHPELEVSRVTASSNAGARVSDVYPALRAAYDGMVYEELDLDAVGEGTDVVFVALPHGESQRHAAGLLERVAHVVDIGADFRLPGDGYATWYGRAHSSPELLGQFAYGLPELFRDEIREFAHVANPGCYPTVANLALAPAMARGLVEPRGLVVDAVSGLSGRGRSLSTESLFSEANESVAAYGLLSHRHTAEMELALGAVAGAPVSVLFTPHVAPMTRGIIATCYARPAVERLSTEALFEHYRDFYRGEPFVHVVDDPPATGAAYGSNSVLVTVRYDERTDTAVLIGVEDNLVKGAAGQAIQNANLVMGFDETAGLPRLGLAP